MKSITKKLISSAFILAMSASYSSAAESSPAASAMSMEDAERMAKELMNNKDVQKALSNEKGKMDEMDMDRPGSKGKMKEAIPDNVKAELKAYHEKKKALREALSPEAKSVLDRRRDRMKYKKMEKMEGKGDEMMKKEKMMNKNEASPAKN